MSEPVSGRAFAPATVANLACGFDVLGLALTAPGDTVTAEKCDAPGVTLAGVEGDAGRLPREPERNTASVAVAKLFERLDLVGKVGVSLHVRKGLPLASGLGSSAASAVAAVVAVNELLSLEASPEDLLLASLEGERVVSGSGHADNAGACLFGGIVLVRSVTPMDVVALPIPGGLSVAVVRPHLEMSTRDARSLIGDRVPLSSAVAQWANVGALVSGLHSGDLELVSRALVDSVAEPLRAPRVPGFEAVKRAALEAGALGCSLSGSGPSIFALTSHLSIAERAATDMKEAFAEAGRLEADAYVSLVTREGARTLT